MVMARPWQPVHLNSTV